MRGPVVTTVPADDDHVVVAPVTVFAVPVTVLVAPAAVPVTVFAGPGPNVATLGPGAHPGTPGVIVVTLPGPAGCGGVITGAFGQVGGWIGPLSMTPGVVFGAGWFC